MCVETALATKQETAASGLAVQLAEVCTGAGIAAAGV